jgi:predicted NUDIX family phosphoesterase
MAGQVPSRFTSDEAEWTDRSLPDFENSIRIRWKYLAESIYGLPRAKVPGGLDWRGVASRQFDPLFAALREFGSFRPRPEAESDPSWKQIIPYVVLRDGDRIFLMRRTRAGGDERLHDRYSIGIGGHINPEDLDVEGGLVREWSEEIEADFIPTFEPIGMLNDDDNSVGAVHLGLVYAAQAGGRPVAIRERDKLEGRFATWAEVVEVADKLETWSALLFEFLAETEAGG